MNEQTEPKEEATTHECEICGALTRQPDLHEQWHERLTKRVDSAASGMMGLMFTDRARL